MDHQIWFRSGGLAETSHVFGDGGPVVDGVGGLKGGEVHPKGWWGPQ
jgi:hypothetical protein